MNQQLIEYMIKVNIVLFAHME